MKTSIVIVLLLVILSLAVWGCRSGPVPASEPSGEATELTQSTDDLEQLGEDLDVGTDWSEFEDLELG